MKQSLLLFILLTTFSSTVESKAKSCRPASCDKLDELSFACSETNDVKKCDEFVSLFDKLLDPHKCPKKKKAPGISYCPEKKGSMSVDLHYDRLGALTSEKALKLYTSKKFRASLDGHIAETHSKRSLRDEEQLGKSLQAFDYDPSCATWEKDMVFTSVQTGVSKAVMGQYELLVGDTPVKIKNTGTSKECIVKDVGIVLAEVDSVKKVAGAQIVWLEGYSGSRNWQTLVNLEDCQKIWQLETSAKKLIVSEVQNSPWKQCHKCWNDQVKECLRY